MKAGYGKAGKQKTLSNFPTATTTTNYNYLWDTDSEGKVNMGFMRDLEFQLHESESGNASSHIRMQNARNDRHAVSQFQVKSAWLSYEP